MINKFLLYLLGIFAIIFGNTIFCGSEESHTDHHKHIAHQEDSASDCCPTQHPLSQRSITESITQKEETKKQTKIVFTISFKEEIVSGYIPVKEKIGGLNHWDKQQYFFTETIRLIV